MPESEADATTGINETCSGWPGLHFMAETYLFHDARVSLCGVEIVSILKSISEAVLWPELDVVNHIDGVSFCLNCFVGVKRILKRIQSLDAIWRHHCIFERSRYIVCYSGIILRRTYTSGLQILTRVLHAGELVVYWLAGGQFSVLALRKTHLCDQVRHVWFASCENILWWAVRWKALLKSSRFVAARNLNLMRRAAVTHGSTVVFQIISEFWQIDLRLVISTHWYGTCNYDAINRDADVNVGLE